MMMRFKIRSQSLLQSYLPARLTARLLLPLCLATACTGTTPPHNDVTLLAPRPFGYVIGDTIRHRLIIDTHNGVQLQRNSLPKLGPINYWLDLTDLTVNAQPRNGGFHYEIDLLYQVFYAPLEVKMLSIPSFNLPLAQGSNTATQTVPAWHFTVSPLRELAVRKDNGGDYMRPDTPAPFLDNTVLLQGLLLSTLTVLASAAYLAYLYGYVPGFPKRSLFKQTGKKLATLTDAQIGEALSLFHQALNTLNGAPVFQAGLTEFYRQHPPYRLAEEPLATFFQMSNQHFFADGIANPTVALHALRQLCSLCLAIERRQR